MPNGEFRTPVGRKAVDGVTRLRRHRGFVQFKLRHLVGADAGLRGAPVGEEAAAIWYLGRRRLTFHPTPNVNPPPQILSMEKVAKLEDIAPGFSAPDPRALTWDPPQEVLAQIMFNQGILSGSPDDQSWVLSSVLKEVPANPPQVLRRPLTHKLFLRMEGLTTVILKARSFIGQVEETVELRGREGEEVVITIANLCDENPLRWFTEIENLSPDQDFKWYYELLSPENANDLRNRIRGVEAPFPLPDGAPNGNGLNCIPSMLRPSEFTMD
ncbi:MAG TPA: hypothetical protein VGG03_14690 [Thermoanaerobaculia bacterium]|jgi:hypothetical protein